MSPLSPTPFPLNNELKSFSTAFQSLPPVSPLAPLSLTDHAASSQPTSLLNGLTEHVTVTHFSEQHGAMEKISVPSVNIFNAEIKTPKVDNAISENLKSLDADLKKNTNNPFLNISPKAIATATNSTNPFKSPTTTTTFPIPTILPNSNPFTDTEHSSSSQQLPLLDASKLDISQKCEQNNDASKKVSVYFYVLIIFLMVFWFACIFPLNVCALYVCIMLPIFQCYHEYF